MKLYELETETPDGTVSSKYVLRNLTARWMLANTALAGNTLRLYHVGVPLQPGELLEQWANGKRFADAKQLRTLVASRYPEDAGAVYGRKDNRRPGEAVGK